MAARKERRNSSVSRENQEEITKAAAWAWYLHGTGKPAKALQESNPRIRQTAGRPSRFKVDLSSKEEQEENNDLQITNAFNGSSLFDSYDIQILSKQLENIDITSFIEGRKIRRNPSPRKPRPRKPTPKIPRTDGFIHPELKKSQKAYKTVHAPVICGIGPVVEPIARKAMDSARMRSAAISPFQSQKIHSHPHLLSHSSQQRQRHY
eukprot:TRINITY_DN32866_c0_g1_i1.p1 TRINITY_DN32866_c0_g1~~TRINITY_DN32866_c0_g1_i1.p1  ORF type:complete len:207 (+),score=17.29 TRINITY_DN32866_c0_g1_i1:150-770(+)